MNKWQKISIGLAALLLFACLALAGVGFWWFNNAGGNVLAAMQNQTPTAVAAQATIAPTAEATTAPSTAKQNTKPGKTVPAAVAGIFGTVASVNGSAITVSAANGKTQTLQIGADSRVIRVGVPNASVSDIKPGDKLLVLGAKKDQASLEPRAVIAVPGNYAQSNIQLGQVQSASAQSLTLTTKDGAQTVSLDSKVQVFGQGFQLAQASALGSGASVIVIGQPGTDGKLVAQLIIAVPGNQKAGKVKPNAPTPTPSQ